VLITSRIFCLYNIWKIIVVISLSIYLKRTSNATFKIVYLGHLNILGTHTQADEYSVICVRSYGTFCIWKSVRVPCLWGWTSVRGGVKIRGERATNIAGWSKGRSGGRVPWDITTRNKHNIYICIKSVCLSVGSPDKNNIRERSLNATAYVYNLSTGMYVVQSCISLTMF
jgi:hypothetical protein